VKRNQDCNRIDHLLARRQFVAGATAGVLGTCLNVPALAEQEIKKSGKQILQIFLQGGVSQLESWDPKPGTKYGGPFRAISTSVPGMQISELLPHTAQRMHHLSIVRSINSKISDHAKGMLYMERGRSAGEFPYIGSVASKYLASAETKLPGYIHITTRGLNDKTAAFLGAQHAELKLDGVKPPANLNLPAGVNPEADTERESLRLQFDKQFAKRRSNAHFDTYDAAFQQAAMLMERKKIFEGNASEKDLARYGTHDFARFCLLARTLLEQGATCVKVTHHGYDSHAENFNFHLEQLEEFDKTFAMLIDDLHDRGMLENTLVLVCSEFGRTPKINVRYGRDHWGTAWSTLLGGCGIQPGAIIGSTNELGTEVADREVDSGHLFHTYLRAVGLDSVANHDLPGRPIPIGDPAASAITELLT
jgi:uncharacterized protein (DUF1501 family)